MRRSILPRVVENWDDLSSDVQDKTALGCTTFIV